MPNDKNRPFYNFDNDDDDFVKKSKEKFEVNIDDDDFFNDSKLDDEVFPVAFSPAFNNVDDESHRKYHTGDTGYVDGIDDFTFDFDAIYKNRLEAQKKMQEEAARAPKQEHGLAFSDFSQDDEDDALPYRPKSAGHNTDEAYLMDTPGEGNEEKTRWIESPAAIRENTEKVEKRRRRARRTRNTTSVLLYIALVIGASVLLSVFTLTALNDIIVSNS